MALKSRDIQLIQGKTWVDVLRWELPSPIVYKPISSVGLVAPMRLGVIGHGLVNGWNVAITGLKDLDTVANDIRDKDYHQATVIDANTIDINDINAAAFKAYVSGGYIQYNTPKDLTGYTARMSVKSKQGEYNLLICTVAGTSGTTEPTAPGKDGAVLTWASTTLPATKEWLPGTAYSLNDVIDTKSLLFLTVGNGRIAVDNSLKTFTRTLSASDIAAQTWTKGYYDLEAVSPDATPIVTLLGYGKISIATEDTK